ncbi:unnamed protein product [Paramecium primaurelia]|uniref:Ubiquitin-like domain-containing protein n=1 Tax=Paramecium primaurelia TaxID=5886 RepID=A0A8S1MXC2_PARPR|nr:unnamed protein product [Paramecium primaurelia]
MKIIIKTLNGSNLEIEVQTTETVLNIKQKIEQLKQFEIDQQKILRKGTILQNEQTVGELGLKEKDLLVVMVNVKKEPPKQQSVQQQFQQQSQQTQSIQEQKPIQVPKPIINSEYLQRNSQYHIFLESLVQKGFSKSQCTRKENKAGFSQIYYDQFYYSKYKDVPFIQYLTELYIKDPEAILQILNEFKKQNPQLLQVNNLFNFN